MSRSTSGPPRSSENDAPLLSQRWKTINPAHAIQRASVIMTFPEQLPSFLINRAVSAARVEAQKIGLVKEEAVNSSIIQIGPGGAQSASPMTQEGSVFQAVQGGQVVQSLQITKQEVRFESSRYVRWIAFKNQFSALMSQILPVLSQATGVQSIAVEYVDFFLAAFEGAEDAGLIIDNQSQFVAKRAFRRRDPFHTHSGWFDSETVTSKRLINVDVTVADQSGPVGVRRTITIRTFEAEHVTNPAGGRGSELMEIEPLLQAVDVLHMSLKERLGHLLTRDAQRLISLNG